MKPKMSEAYQNLRNHQTQLDADGCRIGVSRQALEEVLAEYEKLVKLTYKHELLLDAVEDFLSAYDDKMRAEKLRDANKQT